MCSYYIIFAPEKLLFAKNYFWHFVLFAEKQALRPRKSPAFMVY